MSSPRRYFWGRSLPEALAKAVRYHQIPAESVAYRVVEKRHGFVRHPRAVIIEVDPEAPRRSGAAAPEPPARAATPASPETPVTSATPVASVTPEAPRKPEPARAPRPQGEPRDDPEPGSGGPGRRPAGEKRPPRREKEAFATPDADAEIAALEAVRKLLAFAGLDLEPSASVEGDRLRIDLDGADRERLANEGVDLLDAIDLLLPRAIFTLSGRWVRCRVEGAGLREARDAELRGQALRAAERVRAGEGEVSIEGLGPAERRIVHLELADAADLVTESRGRSEPKSLVVRLARPAAGPD